MHRKCDPHACGPLPPFPPILTRDDGILRDPSPPFEETSAIGDGNVSCPGNVSLFISFRSREELTLACCRDEYEWSRICERDLCIYIYSKHYYCSMMNTLSRVKVMNEGEYFMRFTCDWFLL